MSKVATKSNITLKGSVEIVTEFFGEPPAPPGHTSGWPVSRRRALPQTRRRARPRRLQHQLNSLPTRHLPTRDLPPREQVRLDHACHDGRRAQRLPRERAHAAVPCAACLPHSPCVGPRTSSGRLSVHLLPPSCLTRLGVRAQSGWPRGRCRSWWWWLRGSRRSRRSSAGSSTYTRINRSAPRARWDKSPHRSRA